jgi:hypothetical protein
MKYQLLLSFFVLTILSTNVFAQASRKADIDTKEWRYEIEPVQTGSEGTYLVKVWSYSKKPDIAIEQAKKNAIHGVIFRGFSTMNNVAGQKPLTNNPNLEIEKAEFFSDFFSDGGKYQKYVRVTGDGAVDANDRLKVGKEWKIGVIVTVDVRGLRKDLESASIIRGLSSGF